MEMEITSRWIYVVSCSSFKRCNKIEFQSIPFNENISIIKSGTDFKSSLFNSSRFWMLLFYKITNSVNLKISI